jgi:hypothetical protein
MYISEKQIKAMNMIGDIANEFGHDRWFTQHELLSITKHTMDALVFKHYLDRRVFGDVVYYYQIKELEAD